MKLSKYLSLSLTFISLLYLVGGCTKSSQAASTKFSCLKKIVDGKQSYETIVRVPSQDDPEIENVNVIIDWDPENNYFGSEWTPEKRCEEVSNRFQEIFDRNGLRKITFSEAQWLDQPGTKVICAVPDLTQVCTKEDLLFTLAHTDNPEEVAKELIAVNESEGKRKITRSQENAPHSNDNTEIYWDLDKVLQSP